MKAAAAASPPRACARLAERSSSAAICSSGPAALVGHVPGPPIGIRRGVRDLRQRRVHLVPVPSGCRPVGRRSHQRMTELHLYTELDQAGLHRRGRGLDREAEPAGRPPDQHRVAGRIGRRQQQQPPGRGRQRVQLPPEAVLDPDRQPGRGRQPEAPGQLHRRQHPRQLQQRQRVALGLGDDQVADPRVQRPRHREIQQRPRVVVAQTFDLEFRQPGQLLPGNPGRQHQTDPIGGQPPRHEAQRLRRGVIEPLFVVDHADQRPLRGHLGQQAEHGEPDQEPVRRRPRAHPERGQQRIVLRLRQPIDVVQERRTELVQPGEGQLHLRLDTRRVRNPETLGAVEQILHQRGLAHTRIAAHHQRPALPGPDGLEEPVEHLALDATVRQPCRASSNSGIRSHLIGARPAPGRRPRRCGSPGAAACCERFPFRRNRRERSPGPPRWPTPRPERPRTVSRAARHAGLRRRTNAQERARHVARPPVTLPLPRFRRPAKRDNPDKFRELAGLLNDRTRK